MTTRRPWQQNHIAAIFNVTMFMMKITIKKTFFAMAKIRRIGHDHQAPFFLGWDFKRDTRRKQAATCTIHPGPPIFLQILDPL